MSSLHLVTRAVIVAVALFSSPLALAASFTVDDTNDAGDAFPGDGFCDTGGGVCTLRAAVEESNALAGADSITVPAGTITLTLNSQLAVVSNITLSGAGSTSTIIDGNGGDRVFDISTGNSLTISDLIIRNGDPGNNNDGGAIRNTGSLTLNRVIVRDSNARDGGAVWSRNPGAVLNFTDSSFIQNTASRDGAGVHTRQGSASFTRVTFSANNASRDGGGLWSRDSATSLTNVTFSGNIAGDDGGGVFVHGGTTTLTNATIASNSAADIGGGIHRQTGTSQLLNTILSGNSGGNCSGVITSLGYNLDSANTCALSAAGDLINTNPALGALTDNGGFTETHAIGIGSPAIDAGTNSGCPATDQRGTLRPQDGDNNGSLICDIGAYELLGGSSASLTVLKSVSTVRDPLGAVAPDALAIPAAVVEYEVSVTNSGPGAATELIVTDTLDANLGFLTGEFDGGLADVEIIVGAAAPVFCIAEIGGDTNADGCFLNAAGDDLSVTIPVSVTYPTGLTLGTTAPDNVVIVHFRVTVN